MGGRGLLVVWAVKKTLSRDTPELSRDGLASPTVITNRDRIRVSWSNRPSAPPFRSPQLSATRKVSASLRACKVSSPPVSALSAAVC